MIAVYADSSPIGLPAVSLPAAVELSLVTGLGVSNIAGAVIALIRHCASIGATPKVITGAYVYAVPTSEGWKIYTTDPEGTDILILTGDSTMSTASRSYQVVNSGLNIDVFMTEMASFEAPRFWTRHVQTVETA
jgi:type IV pilus biogenesis protein CpaD/CtpE